MKKLFKGLLSFVLVAFYLIAGVVFIFAYLDIHVTNGIQPWLMSARFVTEPKLLSQVASNLSKKSDLTNPYDFSQTEFNPAKKMQAVVGINPTCFPNVPSNTLDIYLHPESYPNFKAKFWYEDKSLGELDRKNKYVDFFKSLPCPTAGEPISYFAINIQPGYDLLWTYAFKMQDSKLTFVDLKGQPIVQHEYGSWLLALLIVAALFWLNFKFVTKYKSIRIINSIFIVLITCSFVMGLYIHPFWTKIK